MIQKTFNFLSLRINAAQLNTQAGPDVPCETHTHMRFSSELKRSNEQAWKAGATLPKAGMSYRFGRIIGADRYHRAR